MITVAGTESRALTDRTATATLSYFSLGEFQKVAR
jgi:hypothetical protein